MRNVLSVTAKAALILGAVLAVGACNRASTPVVNNIVGNDTLSNTSFGPPANDASAVESVANVAAPATPPPAAGNTSTEPAPSTTGGDTGGNSMGSGIETNVSGM